MLWWCCVLWNITYILMWLIKALSLGLQILNIVYICGYMEMYIYKFVYTYNCIYTFVYIYSVCVFHGSVSFIFHPYGILELMPKILLCHGSRIFSNFCLLLQWIIKHIRHLQGIITLNKRISNKLNDIWVGKPYRLKDTGNKYLDIAFLTFSWKYLFYLPASTSFSQE